MAKITVRTNGQTLRVNASVSHWTTAALAVVASTSDDVESTTTTTITSDYDMHFANTATTAVITVTTPDGTTLVSQTFDVSVGVGPRVLNPVPDAYQRAADDAVDPMGWFLTGHYYSLNGPGIGGAAATFGNGTLRLQPIYIPTAVTITKMGVDMTVAGEASSSFRFGIYYNSPEGRPGALYSDVGTVTTDTGSAVFLETSATLSVALTKGMWWIGGAVQGAASTQPTLRYTNAVNIPYISLGTSAPASAVAAASVSQTGVSGALPASLSSPALSSTGAPRIVVKVA